MTSAGKLMSTKMRNKAFDKADRKSANDAWNTISRASLPTLRERWRRGPACSDKRELTQEKAKQTQRKMNSTLLHVM